MATVEEVADLMQRVSTLLSSQDVLAACSAARDYREMFEPIERIALGSFERNIEQATLEVQFAGRRLNESLGRSAAAAEVRDRG